MIKMITAFQTDKFFNYKDKSAGTSSNETTENFESLINMPFKLPPATKREPEKMPKTMPEKMSEDFESPLNTPFDLPIKPLPEKLDKDFESPLNMPFDLPLPPKATSENSDEINSDVDSGTICRTITVENNPFASDDISPKSTVESVNFKENKEDVSDWQTAAKMPMQATIGNDDELTVRKSIEKGEIEILDSTTTQTAKFLAVDFSKTPIVNADGKSRFSISTPNFSGVLSDVVKSESVNSDAVGSEVVKNENHPANFTFENSLSENYTLSKNVVSNTPSIKTSDFNLTTKGLPNAAEKPETETDFPPTGIENATTVFLPKTETTATTTAPSANIQTNKVLEQIEPQLTQLAVFDGGMSEKKILKMRLHPAELGAVEIRLEKDANGKIEAHFQTENETTHKILSENLDRLRDSLQNAGWQIERLEITCNQFSSGERGSGENGKRQFETSENGFKSKTAANDEPIVAENLKSKQSNRFLSLRA